MFHQPLRCWFETQDLKFSTVITKYNTFTSLKLISLVIKGADGGSGVLSKSESTDEAVLKKLSQDYKARKYTLEI